MRTSLWLDGIPCPFSARRERLVQQRYVLLGAACAAAIAGERDEVKLAAEVLRFFRAVTLPFPDFLEGYYQAVLEAFHARGYLTFKPRAEAFLYRACAPFVVRYSDARDVELFTRRFDTQRLMMENTAHGACQLYLQSRFIEAGERVQVLDRKIKSRIYGNRRRTGSVQERR